MATEKIMVGIDDQVIELKGADKEAFITQRELDNQAQALLEAEYEAKKTARTNAITKLGQASGLTEEEINSILGL
jgi:hypothetical protein